MKATSITWRRTFPDSAPGTDGVAIFEGRIIGRIGGRKDWPARGARKLMQGRAAGVLSSPGHRSRPADIIHVVRAGQPPPFPWRNGWRGMQWPLMSGD